MKQRSRTSKNGRPTADRAKIKAEERSTMLELRSVFHRIEHRIRAHALPRRG
ncbi:hypothetical protein ACGFY3_20510 [Streptomyces mirabilis]|uniref:hypothetical protein n=1 Tax=Streptomyces mirabilis TaxID=68239 RepID=UPI003711C8F7